MELQDRLLDLADAVTALRNCQLQVSQRLTAKVAQSTELVQNPHFAAQTP